MNRWERTNFRTEGPFTGPQALDQSTFNRNNVVQGSGEQEQLLNTSVHIQDHLPWPVGPLLRSPSCQCGHMWHKNEFEFQRLQRTNIEQSHVYGPKEAPLRYLHLQRSHRIDTTRAHVCAPKWTVFRKLGPYGPWPIQEGSVLKTLAPMTARNASDRGPS